MVIDELTRENDELHRLVSTCMNKLEDASDREKFLVKKIENLFKDSDQDDDEEGSLSFVSRSAGRAAWL